MAETELREKEQDSLEKDIEKEGSYIAQASPQYVDPGRVTTAC